MAATTKKDRVEQLASIDQAAQVQQEVKELQRPQVEPSDAGTRQKIAKYFVFAYFILLAVVLIGVPIYNLAAYNVTHDTRALQLSLSETIQTYSAIVGPTLGFVIAYYFKSRDER